jgi:hypothetical protein
MIKADNFKEGLSVVSGANGTWANRANQGTVTVKRSVGKTLKQFNKGTKIGILSGQVFKYSFGGKTVDYLEIILETPIKTDFFTTYFRAVVKADNLDIAPVKITPKLPAKVVAKAKAKVVAKTTTKLNTGTTPTVVSEDQFYQEVPETNTNWIGVVGTVVVVVAVVYGLGTLAYNKFFKPKTTNGNG